MPGWEVALEQVGNGRDLRRLSANPGPVRKKVPSKLQHLSPTSLYTKIIAKQPFVVLISARYYTSMYFKEHRSLKLGMIIALASDETYKCCIGKIITISEDKETFGIIRIPQQHLRIFDRSTWQSSVHYEDVGCWFKERDKTKKLYRLYMEYEGLTQTQEATIKIDDDIDELKKIQVELQKNANKVVHNTCLYHIEAI